MENPPRGESSHHHLSITAVLHFCKSRILNPYLRLLGVAGLRPLSLRQSADSSPCSVSEILNRCYGLQAVMLCAVSYLLQYMACFRRDRGFCREVRYEGDKHGEADSAVACSEVCRTSVLFGFIIPSLLHFTAYIHAIIVFRTTDDDQLPSLVERVDAD